MVCPDHPPYTVLLALSDCASLTLVEYARRDAAAALATVTEQLANSVNDGAHMVE